MIKYYKYQFSVSNFLDLHLKSDNPFKSFKVFKLGNNLFLKLNYLINGE
jgi:hypothetical protein